jgi:hypothetical protein
MLSEGLLDRSFEVGQGLTDRIELTDQSLELPAVGGFQRGRLMQVLRTQVLLEQDGLCGDASGASGPTQLSGQRDSGQLGRLAGRRRVHQQPTRRGRIQLMLSAPFERGQRGRVELLEQAADTVGNLGALPHGVLLSSRQHAQRQHCLGVFSQSMVGCSIGPQDLGQHHRVERIRLCSRGSVAIAVARDRERVDREHLTPSCPQSGHE